MTFTMRAIARIAGDARHIDGSADVRTQAMVFSIIFDLTGA
jgi:hypothetical protein